MNNEKLKLAKAERNNFVEQALSEINKVLYNESERKSGLDNVDYCEANSISVPSEVLFTLFVKKKESPYEAIAVPVENERLNDAAKIVLKIYNKL